MSTGAGEVLAVDSVAALADALRDAAGPVRLLGQGTRRARVPPAPADALAVSLRRLDRIQRLEADDLTCSVEPGVRTRDLDAALAEQGLELGFDDGWAAAGGTVGGLYAADPLGAPNLGVACPRTTILGAEGVLADGTAFRAGARVVKSVAGFDVHKLLVGSLGRLYAAVLLHLKLRPRPERRAWFATEALPLEAAVARFAALRRDVPPLRKLRLRRTSAGAVVEGQCAGRGSQVDRTMATLDVRETEVLGPDHLTAEDGRELVTGVLRPSRIAALLALVPEDAPFVGHGGGHFELACAAEDCDRVLASLPDLDGSGVIAQSARAARCGRASERDPGALRLERALRLELDPKGRLS